MNLPDPVTKQRSLDLAKEREKVLSPREQDIVAEIVGQAIGDMRIPAFAFAPERTHMHLLVGSTTHDISKVVGMIKSRSSSAVIANGDDPTRHRTWSIGYWKVFFFDFAPIPTVQRYIERHNERRGLPGAPHDCITPYVR